MLVRDIPPTAGLPARLRDFFPAKTDFAQSLSQDLGIPQPILTCSGTAALVIALRALAEHSHRDTVIVPAFSCPLVVLAIAHCGLKVQLCDTAPSHFDFDVEKLRRLANDKTLAIIPTHMGGRLADVVAAKEIAESVGAYVIEDAAWAMGARQNGQSVGLIGDVGFFSMAVGKGLTTFEGGVLFSADPALHARLAAAAQKLLPLNCRWESRRTLELMSYALFYRPRTLPYVYGARYRSAVRNNDWLTALGDRFSAKIPMHRLGAWRQSCAANMLSRLSNFHAQTRELASARIQQLKNIPGIHILGDAPGDAGVWPFIMVLMPDVTQRDTALRRLTPLGLGASRLFTCALNEYDYLQPYVAADQMPAASDFARRLLTISCSPWLSGAKFEIILTEIKAAITQPATVD